MKKRLVSLLLTLALLVLPVVSAGAAQPAAADPTPVQTQTETAEAAQHQYSYIALGDSIVAGIGLPDAVYQRNGRYYDVSGNYQGYSKDCYVARVAEGLGLSRDQTANYGMPALMSGDLLELVRTGSCQSASINFSLPDLREELKHAQVITVEIGANDVLVPIMYGIASAMGGPQVFEALLPMLEGDFRQMDASSFAALRENLDSLNITAQQRKALLKLLDSGIAEICTQSQASTLANLEALLQGKGRLAAHQLIGFAQHVTALGMSGQHPDRTGVLQHARRDLAGERPFHGRPHILRTGLRLRSGKSVRHLGDGREGREHHHFVRGRLFVQGSSHGSGRFAGFLPGLVHFPVGSDDLLHGNILSVSPAVPDHTDRSGHLRRCPHNSGAVCPPGRSRISRIRRWPGHSRYGLQAKPC